MVKIFYDTETTGTKPWRHSIHALAGLVEVDSEIVERFDIRMAPHPKALIDPVALRVGRVTTAEIKAYAPARDGINTFTNMLNKYVDPYDSKSKAYLVGYNNRAFDDKFLSAAFELAGNSFFMAYFWADSRDALVLASEYLEDRRLSMPSFKLKRVATELGIIVEAEELHGAAYDAELIRKVYRIVTGKDLEI